MHHGTVWASRQAQAAPVLRMEGWWGERHWKGRRGRGDETAHLSQPGQEPLVTQAVRKEHLRIKNFDGAALTHGN